MKKKRELLALKNAQNLVQVSIFSFCSNYMIFDFDSDFDNVMLIKKMLFVIICSVLACLFYNFSCL